MSVDTNGMPVKFSISAGNINDSTMAPEIIGCHKDTTHVVADKGYDSNEIRDLIIENNSEPVIPRKKNSKIGNDDIKWDLYKLRHLVENVFARLKHFRAIATVELVQ